MKNVNVSTVDMVNIKINGIACRAPAGSTILDAAHSAGIAIPTLCYLKELNSISACRMCVVEVKGAKNLVASCVYPIAEGMEIWTVWPAGWMQLTWRVLRPLTVRPEISTAHTPPPAIRLVSTLWLLTKKAKLVTPAAGQTYRVPWPL